ncbi:MAG: stage V sporulation protein AD [Oscillospiraceae bacterium]
MIIKNGKLLNFSNMPIITDFSSTVGEKEKAGPLGEYFEHYENDPYFGQKTWEEAETELIRKTVKRVIANSKLKNEDIDFIFAGDLLNQCVSSSHGLINQSEAYVGLYGACSTMALSLATGSIFIESSAANNVICATASHFSSAERQFRQPLEYGGQRPPSAQWTVTGAGAVMLRKTSLKNEKIKIKQVLFGKTEDYGICDANNMGAAMAPAAANTLIDFFKLSNTCPTDYDAIITGDLGTIGSTLLKELCLKEKIDLSKNYCDCGVMIFNNKTQDVHSGGSGCGCSASVLSSYFLPKMKRGELSNILFVATGALLSPTTVQQGKSIPSIAHLINIIKD